MSWVVVLVLADMVSESASIPDWHAKWPQVMQCTKKEGKEVLEVIQSSLEICDSSPKLTARRFQKAVK